MPSVLPITGQIILTAVAPPAQDVSGLVGSQAVHSQKPKLPMDEVKETILGSLPADPNSLAAFKQQTSAFQDM